MVAKEKSDTHMSEGGTQSDTPQTDAKLITRHEIADHGYDYTRADMFVSAYFARQLERERDEAVALLRDEVLEFVEGYEDVKDSAEGPVPNIAMHIGNAIRAFLSKVK